MKIDYKKLVPRLKYTKHDLDVIKICKEMIKAGKHKPILVDSKDNERVIDGNHTLAAYQELGIEPPLIYIGSQEDFREAIISELLNNQYSTKTNPALDGVYKMIKDGTVKKVSGEE